MNKIEKANKIIDAVRKEASSGFVCDAIFECSGWKNSYRQIINTIIFCHNQSAGPKYTGDNFKYCPWCGKEIDWENWNREL